MAFVLQQLTDDPADFGIRDLWLENDRWLDDFAEQLSRAPLIWGEPSDEEQDRRTEYLVLCWLVCVERGNALLQRSIRRAIGLEEPRKLDAFQYLAAAAMLLLRNTQLSWPEAVFDFRREILNLAPGAKLPSATKSWNKLSLRESLTDNLLQKAFINLCARPHGEENCLPALLSDSPDPTLLRDLAFRLAFACGMDRQETEQMLWEQEMPGIDFKTAPELLYAYYADRLCGNGKTDPEAYAMARLTQRVYALRREHRAEEKGRASVALEATFYSRQGYRREQKWNMQPNEFLNWMEERKIPAQDCETLLSCPHDARQMLLFCSQLFGARRSI